MAFYPKMRIPLVVSQKLTAIEKRVAQGFRIMVMESGAGILTVNSTKMAVIAPYLMLVNHEDEIELQFSASQELQACFFHPNVVNSEFTLENVFAAGQKMSLTVLQDRYLLDPFRLESARVFRQIDHSALESIKLFFSRIRDELAAQRDKMWPCTARGYLIQLLFFLQRMVQNQGATDNLIVPDSYKPVEGILLYLLAHYAEEITLNTLASRFNTNRTSLAALFKRQLRVTPFEFIMKLRLDIAASLLHNTELEIAEIMERTGFHDLAHFHRRFKQKFNHTPAEYRKQFKKMLY